MLLTLLFYIEQRLNERNTRSRGRSADLERARLKQQEQQQQQQGPYVRDSLDIELRRMSKQYINI